METHYIAWDKIQQELKNFVASKVNDAALAEDIVQDVLIKVHLNLSQLKNTEKISGWIYRIARNAVTDYFRSRSKPLREEDFDWESEHNDLNDCVSACLKEMLQTLPKKYREAIELTELENLPQTQLAQRENISYSGAKSRVQRAKLLLKDKMEELYNIKIDAYGNVVVCENRQPCNCDQHLDTMEK